MRDAHFYSYLSPFLPVLLITIPYTNKPYDQSNSITSHFAIMTSIDYTDLMDGEDAYGNPLHSPSTLAQSTTPENGDVPGSPAATNTHSSITVNRESSQPKNKRRTNHSSYAELTPYGKSQREKYLKAIDSAWGIGWANNFDSSICPSSSNVLDWNTNILRALAKLCRETQEPPDIAANAVEHSCFNSSKGGEVSVMTETNILAAIKDLTQGVQTIQANERSPNTHTASTFRDLGNEADHEKKDLPNSASESERTTSFHHSIGHIIERQQPAQTSDRLYEHILSKLRELNVQHQADVQTIEELMRQVDRQYESKRAIINLEADLAFGRQREIGIV
jgi:hypothetical protein